MKRTETNWIVVHCSALPWDEYPDAAAIDKYHREVRSWSSIGYHLVIRRDGVAEPGRPFDEIGAHVLGHNHNSVAVCWVGGVDHAGNPEDNRTDQQKLALKAVVAMFRMMYPNAKVKGHRDFPDVAKACPSFDAMDEYNQEDN